MWCPSCGDEFRPGYTRCDLCDVALVDQPPAASTLIRRAAWLDDTVAFDLSEWPETRRRALDAWLFTDHVPSVWLDDGAELVVARARAEDVDDLIAMINANADDEAGAFEWAIDVPPRRDGPLASPGRRFVGWVIDAVLVRLVALGVCAVAGLGLTDAGVAAIPVEALYLVIAVAMWGRTAGMVVVRTEIERLDGFVPPGFRVAVVRWLVPAAGLALTLLGTVGVVLNLVWLVAVYAPMLGERRQGLHDRAAATVVVRRP